jgi:hypothetical protein
LIRGCCLGLLLLVGLIGYTAYVIDRAVASPDLGAAPRGPSHGDSELAIAATLAPQLAAKLLVQPHATVELSEHDLTVLVMANNPKPNDYRNVMARVRDGTLLVSADISIGPFSPTTAVRVKLLFDNTAGQAHLTSQVSDVAVGQMALPGWLRDRFVNQVMQSTSLDPLFGGDTALQAVASHVECVAVTATGVRIGIHRPGVLADASICGS